MLHRLAVRCSSPGKAWHKKLTTLDKRATWRRVRVPRGNVNDWYGLIIPKLIILTMGWWFLLWVNNFQLWVNHFDMGKDCWSWFIWLDTDHWTQCWLILVPNCGWWNKFGTVVEHSADSRGQFWAWWLVSAEPLVMITTTNKWPTCFFKMSSLI